MPAIPDEIPRRTQSAVVELRQYTLHPGRRDELIYLFEREFIEPQERLGMEIIGLFRERNDPDLFVWLRGFSNMVARREALDAFYTGPTWRAHGHAANATMIDSDNVLLLAPARPESGLRPESGGPDAERSAVGPGIYVATVYSLDAPPGADFLMFIENDLLPVASALGGSPVGEFVTEPSPNTYPRLPVRDGEQAFVWFARFPSASAYERYSAELAGSPDWRAVVQELERRHAQSTQILELLPTRRSALV